VTVTAIVSLDVFPHRGGRIMYEGLR